MNQEIKEAWAARLASGQEVQIRGALIDHPLIDGGSKGRDTSVCGYCCLGVLTKMYIEQGGDDVRFVGNTVEVRIGQSSDGSGLWTQYDGGIPPDAVTEWADLEDSDPSIESAGMHMASYINDTLMWSFPKIADAIRKDEDL